MGKRGMSGAKHRRAGGGSRAKGRKGKPGGRQSRPNSYHTSCVRVIYRWAA